jgi:sigma-B regulation protein RsbU (phosphoserine phosphatase)
VLPEPRFTPAAAFLRPGETLLLYTDGLTEARTKAGPRYSEEALHAFARSLAPADAHSAISALTGLLEGFGDGLEDDTALLALGVPAPVTATATAA